MKTGEERRVREKALGVLARPRPGKKELRKKMNRSASQVQSKYAPSSVAGMPSNLARISPRAAVVVFAAKPTSECSRVPP